MKKILLGPLLLLVQIFPALSQQEGKLSISTTGHNKILVVIGDTQYTLDDGDLTFRQASTGTYTVQIYRIIRNDLPANEWKSYLRIFHQTVIVINGVHTEITIDRFGRCYINQMVVVNYNDKDQWNAELYVNDDPWLKNSPANNSQRRNNAGVMSDEAFREFKRLIKEEIFEEKMVAFFKNNIKYNLLSVIQVKELCQLFNFDQNKLDLAKYAFDFTADKGNYFMLYSIFTFDFNKKKLEEYIKNK